MRAIVVGNGPSLAKVDLERLVGDTFATNRIHLIYPRTNWRPTYYVRTEPPAGDERERFFAECRLHIDSGEQCIFPSAWKETLGEHPNVEYINTCHHFKYGVDNAPSAWHLPLVCDFGTVVTVAMQLAVLKGYDEIYLIGCDLTGGHFADNYEGAIQTELWRKAHEIAKKSCPVPVYNATVGGELDAYERIDFELLYD